MWYGNRNDNKLPEAEKYVYAHLWRVWADAVHTNEGFVENPSADGTGKYLALPLEHLNVVSFNDVQQAAGQAAIALLDDDEPRPYQHALLESAAAAPFYWMMVDAIAVEVEDANIFEPQSTIWRSLVWRLYHGFSDVVETFENSDMVLSDLEEELDEADFEELVDIDIDPAELAPPPNPKYEWARHRLLPLDERDVDLDKWVSLVNGFIDDIFCDRDWEIFKPTHPEKIDILSQDTTVLRDVDPYYAFTFLAARYLPISGAWEKAFELTDRISDKPPKSFIKQLHRSLWVPSFYEIMKRFTGPTQSRYPNDELRFTRRPYDGGTVTIKFVFREVTEDEHAQDADAPAVWIEKFFHFAIPGDQFNENRVVFAGKVPFYIDPNNLD